LEFPKKKRKIDKEGLISFRQLQLNTKQVEMLKWLVDEEIAIMLAIQTKHLISEKDIECIPMI